jgi:S1-C subfamily serine protease
MNASVSLLHSVLPTSVSLQVGVPARHPSASILGTDRMGSGTIVDGSGIVLTVNYVVLGADKIEATLLDGSVVSADLVAQDFHSGLAAVKIPGGPYLTARPAAAADLQPGQEVFILASSGNSGRRVNSGAVFSLEPFDAFWEYRLERSIITTAMNPGLGGGALFSNKGHLVGVVSLDFNEVGRFTLAIPLELFLDHRDELLQYGRRVTRAPRAWVGLYCHVLRNHVVVAGVLPDGPADGAGLKPGDVVLSVDGGEVHDRRALYERLWARRPGEAIRFQVFRNNNVREISVEGTDAEEFFA